MKAAKITWKQVCVVMSQDNSTYENKLQADVAQILVERESESNA